MYTFISAKWLEFFQLIFGTLFKGTVEIYSRPYA